MATRSGGGNTVPIEEGRKSGSNSPGGYPVKRTVFPHDPNECYVPGYDKGASRQEKIRFAPKTMDAIERVIESGKTPWKTKSELVRCAVDMLLKSLSESAWTLPGETRGMIAACRLVQRQLMEEESMTELQHVLREANAAVTTLLNQGDVRGARRRLEQMAHVFRHVDSTRPWFEEMQKGLVEIRERVREAEQRAAELGQGV